MSSDVIGAQAPRIHHVPPYLSSAGQEAIEIAEVAGLHLDPWEKLVLNDALGETAEGRWAAYRVGLEVARQNGKGAVLEARELAGLFAFGERLIIHSAHEQATSSEHFNRVLNLMEGVPEFDRRILKAVRGKGSESIQLRDGYRIFFKTRTGGGGRGFTGDLVVFDEAMILAAAFMAALVPTMAARSIEGDPQLWFAGSAVDQQKTDHGVEFARVRADALAGVERLAYFGWGLDYESPDEVPPEVAVDPQSWAQANPGLGIRISPQYVADEQRALGPREFAVERLGVGDWPDPEAGDGDGIPADAWESRLDEESKALDPVCFAVDVRPDRSYSSIGSAGWREDGKKHLELVQRDKGTGWVAGRVVELVRDHRPHGVVIDERSPAASLIKQINEALAEAELGVQVRTTTGPEYAKACERLFDDVDQGQACHIGQPDLTAAAVGASKRPLGDAWAWSRSKSSVDITPLVTCTLALWGLEEIGGTSAYEDHGLIVV